MRSRTDLSFPWLSRRCLLTFSLNFFLRVCRYRSPEAEGLSIRQVYAFWGGDGPFMKPVRHFPCLSFPWRLTGTPTVLADVPFAAPLCLSFLENFFSPSVRAIGRVPGLNAAHSGSRFPYGTFSFFPHTGCPPRELLCRPIFRPGPRPPAILPPEPLARSNRVFLPAGTVGNLWVLQIGVLLSQSLFS